MASALKYDSQQDELYKWPRGFVKAAHRKSKTTAIKQATKNST